MAGLFGAPRAAWQEGFHAATQPAQPLQPKNGGWKHAIGILGDALLGLGGRQGVYGPMQMQRRFFEEQQKARQQQAERDRMARREDMQWEWANAPRNQGRPHYWETNDGSLGMVDPATGKPSILYQDPTPKIDWITAENPDGTKTLLPMTRGGAPAARGGPLPTFTEDDWNNAASVNRMSVTPRELDALVNRYGPQAVQRRLDSGELSVRN